MQALPTVDATSRIDDRCLLQASTLQCGPVCTQMWVGRGCAGGAFAARGGDGRASTYEPDAPCQDEEAVEIPHGNNVLDLGLQGGQRWKVGGQAAAGMLAKGGPHMAVQQKACSQVRRARGGAGGGAAPGRTWRWSAAGPKTERRCSLQWLAPRSQAGVATASAWQHNAGRGDPSR